MPHRYAPAADGWLAFVTPSRQLFVEGERDAAAVDRLWGLITAAPGAGGVLEELTSAGLFATPAFALVEVHDDGVAVIVRGGAEVVVGGERISGAGATTWIERRVASGALAVAFGADAAASLPIERGVVRVAAFAHDGAVVVEPVPSQPQRAPQPTPAPQPIPAQEAAPAPAPQPAAQPAPASEHDDIEATRIHSDEVAADEPESAPDHTVMIDDELRRSRRTGAAPQVPAADPVEAGDDGGYDYLFGATMYRSVQDAAVAAPTEDDDEAATPAAAPDDTGDHDGNTVLTSSLPDRPQRKRTGGGAPAAPSVAIVLPSGARETLEQAIIVGRSPSVSGVPAGQLPRLVTISGGDQDISRSHVRFALEGGTVVVTDLHSRNGTTIVLPNGDRQKLRAGEPTPVIVGTDVDLGSDIVLGIEEL